MRKERWAYRSWRRALYKKILCGGRGDLRKNQFVGKGLNLIKGVYTYYKVEGLNLDRLIESLKKDGIALYKIKKNGNREIRFAIKYIDNRKFFAKLNNMWYNTYTVKRIKDGGIGYPLLFLVRNVGIFIGAVVFLVSAVIANDIIFDFSFVGSGSIYNREVVEFLEEKGIKKFSRFSAVNLEELEDGILSNNEHLSFASCKKDGNRLKIELVLSGDRPKSLSGKETELVADVDGEIESAKVYRGTLLKGVGEKVVVGEKIVSGTATVKEVQVNVNVIASVSILYKENFEYISENDGEELFAETVVKSQLEEREPIATEIIKRKENEKYIYTVIFTFRRIIMVG